MSRPVRHTRRSRFTLLACLVGAPMLLGVDACDDDVMLGSTGDDAGIGSGGAGGGNTGNGSSTGGGGSAGSGTDAGTADASGGSSTGGTGGTGPGPDAGRPDSGGTHTDACADACTEGEFCKTASCGASEGVCTATGNACTEEWQPVCGCDGETYGTPCAAESAGANVGSAGACRQAECKPAECTGPQLGAPNYICTDGTTGGPYCGRDDAGACTWQLRSCEMATNCDAGSPCAEGDFCNYANGSGCPLGGSGQLVAPFGTCEPKPEFCTTEYIGVCGCDGTEYATECTANSQGVTVDPNGGC